MSRIDPQLSSGAVQSNAQYGDRQANSQTAFQGAITDNPRTSIGSGYTGAASSPYHQYATPQTDNSQHAGAIASGGSAESHSNGTSPDQQGGFPFGSENQAHLDNSPHEHGADADGQNGDDAKRSRACEACRGLKVRCDQDPAHPEIPCRRCAKAGRQCIITQPSRKRQKKADSRVAELEKKLEALTSALLQQRQGIQQFQTSQQVMHATPDTISPRIGSIPQPRSISQPTSESPAFQRPASTESSAHTNKHRRTDTQAEEAISAIRRPKSPAGGPIMETHNPCESTTDLRKFLTAYSSPEEFVARINTLINPETAAVLFRRYMDELCPHMPGIVFPESITPEQMFKEKPILYVCILSAASFGILSQDASRQIAREAIGAIADCVVRNGAKSLELIQAMQITALWYKPPESAEQTNFYQIIHMAAVMALDIGLGKRFNPAKARRGFGGPGANFTPGPHKALPQDSDTIEARRAWLTCYYLCASASMVLRRPNLIRWTNYMKECIEVLESHPDAASSDKYFCQHIKIQRICEDIGLQFLMDDSTANISITDPKVSYALNVLENQLKTWKENIPAECCGPGLDFFEHVTSLYLHEIALHFNHNIDDFRLPFTEESLKSVTNTSDTLTQNQMAALEACLKSAHGILDTMLSYDVDIIKSLPILLFFVRCVYAIVVLVKMHVAVSTPGNELGKMMKAEDLRVDYYLEQLISRFAQVARSCNDFRPHPKILRILGILREWFSKHKETVDGQKQSKPNSQTHQSRRQSNQTPLDLLSQVATGTQVDNSRPYSQVDWTFSSPYAIDHSKNNAGLSGSSLPTQEQNYQPTTQSGSFSGQDQLSMDQQGMSMIDPMNSDYGWGSGFEQAMDIALGSMDGLQGEGLDNWFLGDSVAPFGFNPPMPSMQWQ
ncbi:Hypothetical protein R9X50_00433600 [Acrodontium crateriforme]|uniref:Zn(2)-C6 fungal-type domain-containing protein n=1 Tax=Acrodontium crateriforme TaxID=150365 RepID=A0AAQ3M614_9PEZI|nr:Hypothetical protein R9X50_00433600 [Acrodontium crateriforme]